MKAVVYEKYGPPDVLEIRDIDKPFPKPGEILVKVAAAAVTPMDWHFMTGTPFLARIMAGGLIKPGNHVLGTEGAGVVQEVGENVSMFHPGDEVFGRRSGEGCYAEYACFSESETWVKPADLSFEQAAALPFSGNTALICLYGLGKIKAEQKVLINGASGGVGTLAVTIAKHFGAEVTGVCSKHNLELVRSIGADHVIDYTQEDFADNVDKHDVIFDAAGKRKFKDCQRALTPHGVYVTTVFSPLVFVQGKWYSAVGKKKMLPMPPVKPGPEINRLFVELLDAGVMKPVVNQTFPLSKAPEAFRRYEKGHIQGRLVICV